MPSETPNETVVKSDTHDIFEEFEALVAKERVHTEIGRTVKEMADKHGVSIFRMQRVVDDAVARGTMYRIPNRYGVGNGPRHAVYVSRE